MAKEEGEAYAARVGTRAQHLEYVRRLQASGVRYTERDVAKWLKISNATAHHLCAEVRDGRKRVSAPRALCDACWEEFPVTQLVEGLCPAHRVGH